MKKGILILVAIVAVIAIACVSTYNGLATGRENVATAQAQIQTALQRRADLIPNVVATVQSFASHETEVFDAVLAAREKLAGATTLPEMAEADQALTSALGSLTVLVENYPELKSDTVYLGLMDELEGSENRIAVARNNYIKTVQEYNVLVRQFPTNLTAMVMSYKAKPSFTVENEAAISRPPTVDFGTEKK